MSKETVVTLDQRLRQRAQEKLDAELSKPLNKHLAVLQLSVLSDLAREYGRWELASMHQVEAVRNHLRLKHINEYVAAETKAFMDEVDSLRATLGDIDERINEVLQ